MQADTSGLARTLVKLGYAGLFQDVNARDLDAIWNEPGAPDALAALAADGRSPARARFLAAEILHRKRDSYPPDEFWAALAGVYAAALAENATGAANAWGLPGLFDGLLAQHVVALGDAAIPALLPLLDDSARVHYAGSQEATFASAKALRVKDLSAWYLARITNRAVDLAAEPGGRDADIDALKQALK